MQEEEVLKDLLEEDFKKKKEEKNLQFEATICAQEKTTYSHFFQQSFFFISEKTEAYNHRHNVQIQSTTHDLRGLLPDNTGIVKKISSFGGKYYHQHNRVHV